MTVTGTDATANIPAPAPSPSPRARRLLGRLDLWAGLLVVAACCAFIFVQLEPGLLFRNTTPSGGDTAAHVWWPAYLRDHLLPFRLAGWSSRLLRRLPRRAVLLPGSCAADRRARRRPPVQRRVQARHRARSGDAARSARTCSHAASAHRGPHPPASRSRRRRSSSSPAIPALATRVRARIQPAHHGRHARQHARRRVLVHDRARVRPRVPRHVRVVAAHGTAPWIPALLLRRHGHEPPRRRDLRGARARSSSGSARRPCVQRRARARSGRGRAAHRGVGRCRCSPRIGYTTDMRYDAITYAETRSIQRSYLFRA